MAGRNKIKRGQQEIAGLNSMAGRNKIKRGQQEIAGFVLIVVIVMIGMMVFLVISLKNDGNTSKDSLEAKNLLDAIMGYTTTCAIVFEPQYDTIEDLFKSAYEEKECVNKNEDALVYLNKSLISILNNLTITESTLLGYNLNFLEKDEDGERGILEVIGGNCTLSKRTESAQRNLLSGNDKLIIRLRLCKG